MTGTTVRATAASGPCRPFAVFGGSMCANVPAGCPACDFIVEQMVPTDKWGMNFHTIPLAGVTSHTYRILADGLKESAPKVPKGAKIIIYYGIWTGLTQWPDAVAKTIYKDETVRVINVPPGQVELGHVGRGPNDVVLFYTGEGFIKSAPLKASN